MKLSITKMALILGGAGMLGYLMIMSNPEVMEIMRKKAKTLADCACDKLDELENTPN